MQKATKQKIIIGSSLVGVVVLCVGAFLLITYDYLTIRSPYVGYELGYQDANIGNEALLSPVMKDRTKAKLDSELKRNKEKYTYDEVTSIAKTVNMDYLYNGKYDINATLLGQEDKILVSVHDTYAPMFVNLYPTLVIEQDALKSYDDLALYFNIEDFDLNADFIVLADNVDLAKEGTYSIHVTGYDTSGNYQEVEVPVNIVSHKTAQLTPDILSINRLGIIPATEETRKKVGEDFFTIDVSRLNFGTKLVGGQVVTDSTTYNQKIKELQDLQKTKKAEEQKYIDNLCKDGYDSTQDEEAKREIDAKRNTDQLKDSQNIQDLLNERKEVYEKKLEEEKKKLEEEKKEVEVAIKEEESRPAESLNQDYLDELKKKEQELADKLKREEEEQRAREEALALQERKATVSGVVSDAKDKLTTTKGYLKEYVEATDTQPVPKALKETNSVAEWDVVKDKNTYETLNTQYETKYNDIKSKYNAQAEQLKKWTQNRTESVKTDAQKVKNYTTKVSELEADLKKIEGTDNVTDAQDLPKRIDSLQTAIDADKDYLNDLNRRIVETDDEVLQTKNEIDNIVEEYKDKKGWANEVARSIQATLEESATFNTDNTLQSCTNGYWIAQRLRTTGDSYSKVGVVWGVEKKYKDGGWEDLEDDTWYNNPKYLTIAQPFGNIDTEYKEDACISSNKNSYYGGQGHYTSFSTYEDAVIAQEILQKEAMKLVEVSNIDSNGVIADVSIRYIEGDDKFGKPSNQTQDWFTADEDTIKWRTELPDGVTLDNVTKEDRDKIKRDKELWYMTAPDKGYFTGTTFKTGWYVKLQGFYVPSHISKS